MRQRNRFCKTNVKETALFVKTFKSLLKNYALYLGCFIFGIRYDIPSGRLASDGEGGKYSKGIYGNNIFIMSAMHFEFKVFLKNALAKLNYFSANDK